MDGDEQLLRTVVEVFLADAPQQIQELKSSELAGSCEEMRRQAHSLKSAAGSAGALVLQELAQDLELAGEAGDLSGAQLLLREIDGAFEQLKRVLAGQGLLGSG